MATPNTSELVRGLDLSDKTIVITGPLSGLGLETSRALASTGANLVLAGRGMDRLESTMDTLRAEHPGATLSAVELDLASLTSVRTAAAALLERLPQIDILINNAGIMYTPEGRTEDGFELQTGVNHLGHFLFTRLLMPLLLAAPGARIINLSSGGHRLGDLDLDDLLWERRPYDKFESYGASKTANILFTIEAERRYGPLGVHSFAVHPGQVRTDLRRFMDEDDVAEMYRRAAALNTPERPAPVLRRLTVDEGAATTVWAAVTAGLEAHGGAYLAECAVSTDAAPYATDPERARRLWDLSCDLVGVEAE